MSEKFDLNIKLNRFNKEEAKPEKKPLILIVDDVPRNLQVLGNILNKRDYKIAVATNGKQALSMIENVKPDLILLDIMMPEMDGYEVCINLKDSDNTSDIPVIFITAKTETEDIIKGFEVGAVDYVLKPFNSAELLARVNTHIQLKLARDREKELISELRNALQEVKRLSGMLPICSHCKKIRSDEGYWLQVEEYIAEHSEAQFSHGICPDCLRELYPKYADKVLKANQDQGGE